MTELYIIGALVAFAGFSQFRINNLKKGIKKLESDVYRAEVALLKERAEADIARKEFNRVNSQYSEYINNIVEISKVKVTDATKNPTQALKESNEAILDFNGDLFDDGVPANKN